jgi:hypothetical protein
MKRQGQLLSPPLLTFLSFLTLALILALFATPAHSADVSLAWDPNTEPDLAGYNLYYKSGSSGPPYNGTGATEDDSPVDVGNVTEFTLHGLTDGVTYFFVVTAYDTEGLESGYSNEVNTGTLSPCTVTSITSSTADGYYKTGDTVNITLSFSEAVTLAGGSLVAILDIGATVATHSISSQTSVTLTYTVQAGDESSDLTVEALLLSQGATLRNEKTLDCDLSVPAGSNLADHKDIVIDAVAPSSRATAPTYGNSTLSITWKASDATSGVATTELWYKRGSTGTWSHTGLTAQMGTSGTFSYTPAGGDATYYFATRAADNAGNREVTPSGAGDTSTIYDTIPPHAPVVAGATPTKDTTPTWSWSSGGGGNGTYRYKVDNSTLSSGATQTTATSYTPASALAEGSHTLYIQERDTAGNWSNSGTHTIVIDTTEPGTPVIITDGGNGPGSDYTTDTSSITLEGRCAADTVAIYVNGSVKGVTYKPGETSWSYASTLVPGENTLTITARDAAGNLSDKGSITVTYTTTEGKPVGGYSKENVIPAAQITQSATGEGIITIRFKIIDPTNDLCTLHSFHYSVNGGKTWTAPTNGDSSGSLSKGWQDKGGAKYSSAPSFTDAKVHAFTFNTKHQDVSGLDGEDQSDVRIRFILNDGTWDSASPVTSEEFRVDNLSPTVTLSHSAPNVSHVDVGLLTITATCSELLITTPRITIERPDPMSTIGPITMSGSGCVWTYALTVERHNGATVVDGVNVVTISNVTDLLGNAVQESGTFTTDTRDTDSDGERDYTDTDDDNDGLPDSWEEKSGLDPLDSTGQNGRDGDLDNDGWSNYEEYMAGTDPCDDTSNPAISPPEIVETIPHHNAGLNGDRTRVPVDTSFSVLIEDTDGIDITDVESITFTISDGVHEAYRRDLSDETVVRVMKLTEEEDLHATKLWAVYDRCRDDQYKNSYAFDAIVTIGIDVKDNGGLFIDPVASYTFKIESELQHSEAHDLENLPDTIEVSSDDPDLEDPQYFYDAGIQVKSGDLAGAKVIYNSSEPVIPRLGPTDEIPPLAGGCGVPLNVQPPTVFNTPVKIFIPSPGPTEVTDLTIYVYKGGAWALACDISDTVQTGGDSWMVPGSRVNHNNRDPSTIEIKAYHLSAVQGKPETDFSGASADTPPSISDNAAELASGCFIATAAFASNMNGELKAFPGIVYLALYVAFIIVLILLLLRMLYCTKCFSRSKGNSA